MTTQEIKIQKFYKETTKEQMFTILSQFATLLVNDDEKWIDKVINEKEILKINNLI